MIQNYITKILLAQQISRNLKTFLDIIINSKRYSSAYKKKRITNNNSYCSYPIQIQYKKFTLHMRTYSGDFDIFYEVFWKKTYNIPREINNNFDIIVDLGAHIGMTTIQFAILYPQSRIIAVEASEYNFALLIKNTCDFKNVHCLHSAAYPKDGHVLFDSSGISYNSKISESGNEIRAISIQSLMEMYNLKHINLLKIDIEGAEELLLNQNNSWLEKVDNIIIEIHAHYHLDNLKQDLEPFGFIISAPMALHPSLKNIFAYKSRR